MNYNNEINNNVLWMMVFVMFMKNHSLLEFMICLVAGALIYGATKVIDRFM